MGFWNSTKVAVVVEMKEQAKIMSLILMLDKQNPMELLSRYWKEQMDDILCLILLSY